MEKKFLVEDMSCKMCEGKIKNKLKEIKGLKVNIDLSKKEVVVKSKEDFTNEFIINEIKEAGYTALIIE